MSSSLGTLFPLSGQFVLPPDQRWLPRPVLPHCCCIKCGPRLEGNGPISLKGYWWKHHLCNVGQFWTRWLPDTVKRFCFLLSNPRSECHIMSDSKPCSCVCFFLIDHPYVPILKNLAHSYFLVASRNLSFLRPLVLHCGTLGKLTDKAGHDIPSSVQGKRFVAFQVSCLLALLPNARTSLQATWVQKIKTVVNRCQKIQMCLNVTKCFQNNKLLNIVNWIVNRIVKPRYSLVCWMSIISCPV